MKGQYRKSRSVQLFF